MHTKEKRNVGIDLLRIVSMWMVVILHILGKGGVLETTNTMSLNYSVAWLLEIAAYCAVDCYALISGYVGIKSKHKASGVVSLWLQVTFYSVLITVIMSFTHGVADISDIVKSFLPVTFSQYWYFTAYFGMWFFVPFMNASIEQMSKKLAGFYLIAIGVVLLPVSIFMDPFLMVGGHSVIWLCYLYLIGAYVNKHDLLIKISRNKAILMYLLCVVITFAYKVIQNFVGIPADMLISNASPLILAAAFSLLSIFAKIDIPSKLTKAITLLGSLSFSVYLIHTHPLVFTHIMNDKFSFLGKANPLVLIVGVVFVAVAIFVICTAIDYIRLCLFKLIRVRKVLDLLETRVSMFLKTKLKRILGE